MQTIDNQIKDYKPLPDEYPELKLILTTNVSIPILFFRNRFDYVQNLYRTNENGRKETFHILFKDRKRGLLYYNTSALFDKAKIALPALYEEIKFLYKKEKSFVAIVKRNGKYGLCFWEYGLLANKILSVPTEYDSMEQLPNKRFKGIKNRQITYFDETGHILK